jgi:type IV pilus assembly protein PilN
MIRINLLGVPRPKKGKRGGAAAAVVSMPGEGPGGGLVLVGGLVLGLAAAGGLWYVADKDQKETTTKLEAAVRESTRLNQVKVKYEQRKKEADAFEKRVKVIDQLHNDQTGPVNLLNTVGNTVNNTDAVWLSEVTEAGNNINVSGTALTTTAVANLMTNLKRTGYFKNIEIKDATQDANAKDITQFNFNLVCEKQPKS